MKAHWLVAKYMPDLRRREPDNVGVILFADGRPYMRFLGQKPDGKIDGRSIRWAGSVGNYKAWIGYWTHVVNTVPAEGLPALLARRRGDDSYIVEMGGERILGAQNQCPEDLLDQLYSILVEDTSDRRSVSVSKLAESVFNRIQIYDQVQRGFKLEVEEADRPADSIYFDYRYDNGQVNLMQLVSLVVPDERSWDSVHAAAWAFARASNVRADAKKQQQIIALVNPREGDHDLHRQMAVLSERARVVDLSDETIASERLAELLHVAA